MKIYAFIQNSEVAEIIPPATDQNGKEIDVKDRFAPAFVAEMVDITDVIPQPGLHWTYENGIFQAPKLFPVES